MENTFKMANKIENGKSIFAGLESKDSSAVNKTVKLLIADENHDFRRLCRENLSKRGFSGFEEAASGDDALAKIERFHPDAVICDTWLGKLDAVGLISGSLSLRFSPDSPPFFIVVSSVCSHNLFCEATEAGADYCMLKPIDFDVLSARITKLYEKRISGKKGDGGIGISRDLETQVTNVIHRIGVPAHIKGYQYIRQAIIMAIENSSIINSVTKELYPSVAKHYETTPSRVERAIRHAIEVAWDRGDLDTLESFFGYSIDQNRGKPTNSEFIAMISDNIRISNKVV